MKIYLKTSIVAFAAALSLTSIANAEDVRIAVAGKDARTLHTEIVRAATRVCGDQNLDLFYHTSDEQCVAATVAKANEQLQQSQASRLVAQAGSARGER